MEKKVARPEFVTDKHLEYLDDLRESGITNMFGAAPFLKKAFRNLSKDQSEKTLVYWMQTFGERHPK